MNKMLIILIRILIVVVVLVIGYFWVGDYFFGFSLKPKKTDKYINGNYGKNDEEKAWWKEQLEWLSNNSKDIHIQSTNNGDLTLHGYEINNENSNDWVIVVHGYMSRGTSMVNFAREFSNRNYNVLVVDLRAHGLSEGKYIGMGWLDRLDLIDWINYIIEQDENRKVMLFGISMGGATVMMATGEELPSNVKLAISDCGYTSAWDEFKYRLKKSYCLPSFPVLYAANNMCKAKAKYSLKEASSVEQIKKSKTPTLFIHGSEDTFVPFEMLEILFREAACEKEKVIIEGATHCASASTNPELYWHKIDEFIKRYNN